MRHRLETVIDGDALTLAYADSGTGDAVVFLHALGRSSSDWQDVIAELSRSHRCIAVDLPGHGDSSRVGRYSFDLLARATHRLIDHLGLDSLSIVAHSMGGTTALVLAPDLGGRLRKMVVEDTGLPTDQDDFPEVPPSPPEAVQYDWEARRQIVAQLRRPDPRWHERLAEITAPVLVIAGHAGDEELGATVAKIPGADLVTIPVGHWIHQDALDEFLEVVRRFLDG